MARANKKYFDTLKEARTVAAQRGDKVFKLKRGRNKGKYFVGQWIEWVNLY